VYVDFDPEQRRISGLLITNYRKRFLRARTQRQDLSPWRRIALRVLIWLGAALRGVGVDADLTRRWDRIAGQSSLLQALNRWRAEIVDRPDRVVAFGHPHATVP